MSNTMASSVPDVPPTLNTLNHALASGRRNLRGIKRLSRQTKIIIACIVAVIVALLLLIVVLASCIKCYRERTNRLKKREWEEDDVERKGGEGILGRKIVSCSMNRN